MKYVLPRHIRANKRLSGAFLLPEPRPLTPVMRGAHGSVWRARESIKLATYSKVLVIPLVDCTN